MTALTLRDLVASLREPTRPFHLFLDDAPFSASELYVHARGVADRFSEAGVRPGDRVALILPTSLALVAALLACAWIGAVAVPIHAGYRAELRPILGNAAPSLVVIAEEHPLRDEVARYHDAIRTIWTVPSNTDATSFGLPSPPNATETRDETLWVRSEEPTPSPDDPALVVYTSGSTGTSKGAVLSHRAILDNTAALRHAWAIDATDVLSFALPLFHVHGLCVAFWQALGAGASIRLGSSFSAERVVADLALGATVFMGVPTMYERLANHLEANPEAAAYARSARLFVSGSAPLPAALFDRFQRLTGHAILERYGMTETLITLSAPLAGPRTPGTVGFPVPGCRIRIVEEDGQEVAWGQPGELLVRSNGTMLGYFGMERATRASFEGPWFKTGDIACQNADGSIRIVGRKGADFIKSGGFKISALEIEDVLRRHPAVSEAAVVGLPDPSWGERVVAVIVPRAQHGCPPSDAELRAHVGASLAEYKKPKAIYVWDALPRNALGKVQKHLLVAKLLAAGSTSAQTDTTDTTDTTNP